MKRPMSKYGPGGKAHKSHTHPSACYEVLVAEKAQEFGLNISGLPARVTAAVLRRATKSEWVDVDEPKDAHPKRVITWAREAMAGALARLSENPPPVRDEFAESDRHFNQHVAETCKKEQRKRDELASRNIEPFQLP